MDEIDSLRLALEKMSVRDCRPDPPNEGLLGSDAAGVADAVLRDAHACLAVSFDGSFPDGPKFHIHLTVPGEPETMWESRQPAFELVELISRDLDDEMLTVLRDEIDRLMGGARGSGECD